MACHWPRPSWRGLLSERNLIFFSLLSLRWYFILGHQLSSSSSDALADASHVWFLHQRTRKLRKVPSSALVVVLVASGSDE
jgi:hypothetical protein